MADKEPLKAIEALSFLHGTNSTYVLELYKKFQENPYSIDESWQEVFFCLPDNNILDKDSNTRDGFSNVVGKEFVPRDTSHTSKVIGSKSQEYSNLNGQTESTNFKNFQQEHNYSTKQATIDSTKALMLIRAFRIRGHMLANLDPLKLSKKPYHSELDPENYGFFPTDMERPIFLNYVLGLESANLKEVLSILKKTYCNKIGVEYMHIQDYAEKSWIQERMENSLNFTEFTTRGKQTILQRLLETEEFEKFLAKKHTGAKRFGLEGAETTVPLVEQILKRSVGQGLQDAVIGMAHRGRLNFLANVLNKPYRAIFSEFKGNSSLPEGMGYSGDVKYHLGASANREFGGKVMHLSLNPNPSHLEAVNTVVLGKVRAKQKIMDDHNHTKVMPILIHGDAAFSGQGVVAETVLMSNLDGYSIGGTIHLVINNQIGFTTMPIYSRSSPYCTDIAKSIGAPIFHVNGDDPEACLHVARIATDYRYKFGKDVVIDMICYRRYGHNESDEPFFTQPKMYSRISKHPSVYSIYKTKLFEDGTITEEQAKEMSNNFNDYLEEEFSVAQNYKPNKADWLEGLWSEITVPTDEVGRGSTSVTDQNLKEIFAKITNIPDKFNLHPKLVRQIKARVDSFNDKNEINWSLAEALAFGSLVTEGTSVRLSGEDSKRGTFSQRHAVYYDQKNEDTYIPLSNISPKQAPFEILDSPLSEFGVLGFEYGYACTDPKTLVLWEAQFGDFANGAQVIIDQFIASGEVKWLRLNGLVLLLPHGYEGAGPEHSSARLERYLQMCAENNLQICNPTTPANYFHVLRRQINRNYRKPLIIMTPKSLLRNKLCLSKIQDFTTGSSFHRVLPDRLDKTSALVADNQIKQVVICSGKVFYDLLARRDEKKIKDVYIIRLEQLYPFPSKVLIGLVKRFPFAKFAWLQEEPKNMGAWAFVEKRIHQSLIDAGIKAKEVLYIGRNAAASPATGLMSRHLFEQKSIIEQALLINKIRKNKS